ncbi:MAG: YraN family protein [Patescibacteria group bacterium]
MKKFNRQTGASAENIAANHLIEKGYGILERNFRNKFGEIDIIAKDKNILVFVEVKAKIGGDFGLPEEMISKGKLQRVRNMATMYMNGELLPCRIDVVAIVLDENNEVVRLTHYENVY